MREFIIKYKDAEDNIAPAIKAIRTQFPSETIKALREIDCLQIDGRYYEFVSAEYKVPSFDEELEVVNVYIIQNN